MKVFLLTVSPAQSVWRCREEFESLARCDRFGVHQLTASPDEADIVLVTDLHWRYDYPLLRAFYGNAIVRRYAPKVFAYDIRPNPFLACPGVFVSMEAPYFDARFERAAGYHRIPNPFIEGLPAAPPAPEHLALAQPRFLGNFIGARSHPLREAIFSLDDPRFDVRQRAISGLAPGADDATRAQLKTQAQQSYLDAIRDAKFVLCPRGVATSSFRMYETMALARVPVVLSDHWVAPNGPDWDECILRVPEREVARLPQILEQHESRWRDRGARAWQAWHDYFAPPVRFHRAIEACAQLQQSGVGGPQPLPWRHPAFWNAVRGAIARRSKRQIKSWLGR